MLLNDGESPEALGLDGLGPQVASFSQGLDASIDAALGTPLAQG